MIRESCIHDVLSKFAADERAGRHAGEEPSPNRSAVVRVLHALVACGYRVTLDVSQPTTVAQAAAAYRETYLENGGM